MASLAGLAIMSPAGCHAQEEPLELHFFYTPGCSDCRELRRDIVLPLVEANPRIDYHEYDLSEAEATETLIQYYVNYAVPEEYWGASSAAFLGDLAYAGTDEVTSKL
ncbi:MAG: hypothetical protein GF393_01970, partial [Armatimonadia bacterium]|nr:hypothetical protein [Armatimonadia bacterium]